MCGIVGVLSHKQKLAASEDVLIRMRDQMEHRGPDDAGIFLYNHDSLTVGFGHRRLSIIDLSPLAHQPMGTADGTLWITFNGEVFNYKDLRQELIRTDKYRFQSKSDTEVILYGVREWGLEGCLKRIRGMYAFALFDKMDNSLSLVRDPLGVKPLYYYHEANRFAFASEIKALLAMPGSSKRLNESALYHYLTFANSPAPETLFKGIRKLEAGTYLKIERDGHTRQVRYWDPTLFQPNGLKLAEKDYVDEIRRLLRQSIQRRMVSDVPFGVFLSGGVDSSLNVAFMAERMNRPVDTFSVGIEGDLANEFKYARRVAKHFGANHHEILIDEDDFISFLPKMALFQDEPLADPVCVPLYYLSKLARDSGTTVIQVGEGSDEVFAGYGTYHFFNRWNRTLYQHFLHWPSIVKKLLYVAARKSSYPYVADAFRRGYCNEPLFNGNAIAFWDEEKTRFLKTRLSDITSSGFIGVIQATLGVSDSLASIIQVELKNRLPELLLMRVDKMSMANSIETRVPFLDEDLVEFALTIPSALKNKNGIAKYVLKKAAEDLIPPDIIYRKKWGFCGSATNMLTDRIIQYARVKVLESPLSSEIFDRDFIISVFNDHARCKRFNSFKIWNLLNLVLWHEQWFEDANSANK